jgi:hypothetical protein
MTEIELITLKLAQTEYVKISQTVTIIPRLEYAVNLLDEIIAILHQESSSIKKSNQIFMDCDKNIDAYFKPLDLERKMLLSLEILSEIKNRTRLISGIKSIPKVLPVTISLARTVSALLFYQFPICSQKLSELSVHLGSIVFDSGVLTEARFDFAQTNTDSSVMLEKVKLTVDSNLNKQYPNVDFFKSINT